MKISYPETKVFKIKRDLEVCPPQQVFDKQFNFLLTMGGGIAEDENQYKKLMTLLKKLGESEFNIVENLKKENDKKNNPFVGVISTNSTLKDFNALGRRYDEVFGWLISHFFIYGKKESWGIYLCEYPTINIIGCDRPYVEEFKSIFGIVGNGFQQLKEYISKEFFDQPNSYNELIKNYRL